MSDHPLEDGVAVRVSALCLTRRGRPSPLLICSSAVRAGLLLDLALAGRITHTERSIELDATPTGFAPADELLDLVLGEPDRPLDGWLDDGRLTLDDLVAANVASGRWEQQDLAFRRDPYVDLAPDRTRRDLARSADHVPDDLPTADACVTVVGTASGLLDRRAGIAAEPGPALLAATGDVRWLAEHVAQRLVSTYWHNRHIARALRNADGAGPG